MDTSRETSPSKPSKTWNLACLHSTRGSSSPIYLAIRQVHWKEEPFPQYRGAWLSFYLPNPFLWRASLLHWPMDECWRPWCGGRRSCWDLKDEGAIIGDPTATLWSWVCFKRPPPLTTHLWWLLHPTPYPYQCHSHLVLEYSFSSWAGHELVPINFHMWCKIDCKLIELLSFQQQMVEFLKE